MIIIIILSYYIKLSDDNMKMNFLEPLHNLSTKDIKEVMVRGQT